MRLRRIIAFISSGTIAAVLVSLLVVNANAQPADSKIDENNFSAGIWSDMGNALYGSKMFGEAINAYSKAIELDPEHALAYFGRGLAYAELKIYDKAAKDFGKAIELDPAYALAYFGRGGAYIRLNRIREGCADWIMACGLGECSGLDYAKQRGDCK